MLPRQGRRHLVAPQGGPRDPGRRRHSSDGFVFFAASGAEWIDLHWGFQALAAMIFGHGGICRADARRRGRRRASASPSAIAAATAERSAVAVVWCWLPAVFVMSAASTPRPENAVARVPRRRALTSCTRPRARPAAVAVRADAAGLGERARALCPGPRSSRLLARRAESSIAALSRDAAGLAAPGNGQLVAVAAHLLNPYTWKGVLFPLTLFRRMSTERGFYAQHIGELASIPWLVLRTGISSVYLRVSFLLLAATAASFALRRTDRRGLRFGCSCSSPSARWDAGQPQPAAVAIVAGAVLAWNVGDWLAARPDPPLVERAAARILTSAVARRADLWVVTGRFYGYAGERPGRRSG